MLERIKIWWHTRRQAARDFRNIRRISHPVRILSQTDKPVAYRITSLTTGKSVEGVMKDGLKWVTPAEGTVQNPQDPSPRSRITRHGR